MLDLAGVHEVRWEGGGEPVGEYTFFYAKGNDKHKFVQFFFLCIRESYQQLKRVEFVSDRMSYIILKGR
jgi:hypothetical protein